MLNKTLALLLIFSLAFNIAFVGIWAYVRVLPGEPPPPAPGPEAAVPPEMGPADGRGGRRTPWSHLNLRPQQDELLRGMWTEYQEQMRVLGEEAGEHRGRLFELLGAEDLNPEAIRAEQDAIDDAQQEMSRLTLDQMRRVHQVLTPDQRRRWLQSMKDHGERLRGRYGGRGPGRQGVPVGPGPRGMRGPEGRRGGSRRRWGDPGVPPGPQSEGTRQVPERRPEDEAQ
jgi:Spy/CpxP family protein refolding chaperone